MLNILVEQEGIYGVTQVTNSFIYYCIIVNSKVVWERRVVRARSDTYRVARIVAGEQQLELMKLVTLDKTVNPDQLVVIG